MVGDLKPGRNCCKTTSALSQLYLVFGLGGSAGRQGRSGRRPKVGRERSLGRPQPAPVGRWNLVEITSLSLGSEVWSRSLLTQKPLVPTRQARRGQESPGNLEVRETESG